MSAGAESLKLSWDEVVEATGARVLRPPSSDALRGVSTDSRRAAEGGLFVGISGERFDGSDYAAQALLAGASAALVSDQKAAQALRAPSGGVLAVDDTTRALGLLARWHRRRMPARVVAVTGSNGKTTTKEMLAAICRAAGGDTLATEGNLNNEIGAPLTLLGLAPHHRFAVVEIGMSHEGEIGRLAAMTEPHVGVVTNAAAVHVEGLGGLEGVSRAKAELYHSLPLDAVAVANADDPLMGERARRAGRRSVWFGRAPNADVRLESVLSHDARGLRCAVRVRGEALEVALPVVGVHNALNACAAFAAALALELPVDAAVLGLSLARPPGRRLRLSPILEAGATLLDDCYNANPASAVAALRTLSELAQAPHRVAVLGDMRELGAQEESGHREVGVAAARAGLKLLVAFGPASRHLARAAVEAGLPEERVVHTDDPDAAAARVRRELGAGDVVLVKASRGTRLERVSDRLVVPEEARS